MSTHLEGPAASSAYRVPRTRVDDYYVRGVQVEPVRSGTGVIVSVDGETCTVLIGDEEVSGVVHLGDPPIVGDAYELELRGDLLVILPDDYDYDAYLEGGTTEAQHVVSDTQPTAPDPVELNVAGSMRSLDSWTFDVNAHGWKRTLDASGVGVRAYQAAGTLQARNLCPTPSFETGLGLWESNVAFGTQAAATLSQDSTRFLFGSKALKVVWPDKGATGGSNAVHPAIPLVAGVSYTLSVHVYVPEGSPDVRACGLFTSGGPMVTEKEQWIWTSTEIVGPANGNGDYFGVSTADPVAGGLCWVDAVVLRKTSEPLPPGLTYFDGSQPATAETSYAWEGVAFASVSDWYNGQLGVPGTGTLWSTEAFTVHPGDVLDLTATASKLAGADATAQLVVCYGSDVTIDPVTTVDPILSYGAAVAINGADVSIVAQAIVPQTLPDGTSVAATAVIGYKFVGPGTSDLVVSATKLTRTLGAFPLGSLWLNPAAGQGAPTIGTTAQPLSATDMTWQGSASAWGRMPSGYKALVTAPPDSDGIVLAFYMCALNAKATQTTPITLSVAVQADGALSTGGGAAKWQTNVTTGSKQEAVSVVNWARIAAGSTVELWPGYQYASDPGTANVYQVRNTSLTILFIPSGVVAGESALPAPVSYWDGDSWRPGQLNPATMDLTKLVTTAEPGKTATATTIARSDGDVHEDTSVTLTATVTPTAADGSVTFYSSPTGTGSWTSVGSDTLDANNKATKVVKPTGSKTTYYRATYTGTTTHAASTSANTSIRSRTKKTKTINLNAQWVGAYAADGSKITVGTYANGVQQGDVGGGSSNRRSVIGFNKPAFTGTDVTVTGVTLVCSDWRQWQTGNHQGTLVVGWHSVQNPSSAPNTYPFDRAHNDKSRHGKGEGSWTANITSWADNVVQGSDFGGISIGPGPSMSAEYGGWSNNGPGVWDLQVEYTYWD